MSLSIANAIWRARQNALSRAGERAPRSAVAQHGYDPNQPRAPVGHPDGGQWTRDAHGPSNPEEVVLNEDGSTVRSEVNTSNLSIPWEERHTVRMPDGEEFTFENFGFTQTIYDADGRPISQTVLTSDGRAAGGRRVSARSPCAWRPERWRTCKCLLDAVRGLIRSQSNQ